MLLRQAIRQLLLLLFAGSQLRQACLQGNSQDRAMRAVIEDLLFAAFSRLPAFSRW